MAISNITQGVYWHAQQPVNPCVGSAYVDHQSGQIYMFDGTTWLTVSNDPYAGKKPEFNVPTEEELQTHPTLKGAWEEYMIIRKLLGLPCGKLRKSLII